MKRTNYTLADLFSCWPWPRALSAVGPPGPDLTPGVWKNITPPGVTMTLTNHVFCQGVTLDPAHPSTIYLCVCAYDVDKGGLFKTTDGGVTWARIGKLDEPLHVAVDPHDSKHLYCVDGVRGRHRGVLGLRRRRRDLVFPAGFQRGDAETRRAPAISTRSTSIPRISSTCWSASIPPGPIPETAVCWKAKMAARAGLSHNAPDGSAGGYGMAVFFLYNPETKQGDSEDLALHRPAGRLLSHHRRRATWTLAYKLQMTHGGEQLYRTKDGTLYAGAYQYPVRSTDNGATWEPLKKGLVYSWYMGICGDGSNLYTACSNENQPFFTSPEKDGSTWTAYRGGKQKFSNVPFEMRYDAATTSCTPPVGARACSHSS